jgi:phage shock protein PspC (stress-responsive transcriptional regulator)
MAICAPVEQRVLTVRECRPPPGGTPRGDLRGASGRFPSPGALAAPILEDSGEVRRTLWKELKVASTLTRPRHGKVIAGVCAGLAERFGWSPFAVRLAFVLSCLLPGPQFVAYIVLWVIMPKRPY